VGKAELTGLAHGAGREDKGVRAMARRLAIWARETERERERAGEGKLAPTDRPQRAESEREIERALARETDADRRGPPVRGDRRARDWAWWAGLGRNGFFFFPRFSNSFSISFSIRFSNPNSN
jgi:hypothetical protein